MFITLGDQQRFITLLSIIDLGGSGRAGRVLDNIEKRGYIYFIERDLACLESDGHEDEPRWSNDIRWARNALADEGHIDRSIYGIWRITEKGKRYFWELCSKVVELNSVARGVEWELILGGNAFARAEELLLRAKPVDFNEPSEPSHIVYETCRPIRDTAKTRQVKVLHRFRCQICGDAVQLLDGQLYAEGHHIRPLSHNGPDEIENILCVCPNHHAQLDYGAIELDRSSLRKVEGHVISDDYVAYHNGQVFGKLTLGTMAKWMVYTVHYQVTC